MRKLIVSILVCLTASCGCVSAQTGSNKSANALISEVFQFFPDQNAGQINPFNTRQMLLDMIASSAAASLKFGPVTPQIPSIASGELYYDSTGVYAEQNSAFNIVADLGAAAPPGLTAAAQIETLSQGNNTTFIGGLGLKLTAKDRSSVTTGNKGVQWGLYSSIQPSVTRNNSPFDDADGVVIQNDGTAKATDGLFIGQGSGLAGSQWGNAIAVHGSADTLFLSNGTYTNGIDFTGATISTNAIRTTGFTVNNQGTVIASGLQSTNYLITSAPVTLTGTSGTLTASNTSVIFNPSGTFTATLPTATAGLWLHIKTIANQAVNSASSNVIPRAGGAAGTAILTGTAGQWAILQADGTNWNVMAGN